MSKFRFSTLAYTENMRLKAFQEIYASIANLNLKPYQSHAPFVDMMGLLLPNLGVYESTISPHLSQRTAAHVAAESNDSLALLIPINNSAVIFPENGAPLDCLPGEAVLIPADSIHQAVNPSTISIVTIVVPRKQIATRVSQLNDHMLKKINCVSAPELQLLVGYVRTLIQIKEDLSPKLASLVSTQIHDLLSIMLGAKRGELETAEKQSLRALRLAAIKKDIREHIAEYELSIHQVAFRQGISPQYIRSLFHSEGTTFADYVTELRLERAYQLLRNPLYIDRKISTLAFDMGFNNLSWFNRAFKQKFGLTPSEVRELI